MKTAVLLINLGTPDSPSVPDVKRYLTEFLMDPRVIDVPWLWRQILVKLLIIRKRKYESAANYQKIWTSDGSPLLFWGKRVKELLQVALGQDHHVELAMRYQNPSISKILEKLRGYQKLVVLPLFPQYASASTGSSLAQVMEVIQSWEVIPEVRLIQSFPIQPEMIQAFADRAKSFPLSEYDHVIMSFHGLPERQIKKGDLTGYCLKKGCCATWQDCNRSCYKAQCHATASAIAKELKVSEGDYSVTFQSRLGNDPWIKPYTQQKVHELAKSGCKKLLVFSPAFVADCLETIDEIGNELSREFYSLGGERLDLVPSLNDHPLWIQGLAKLVWGEVY
jgi:ferrochelatase